MNINAKRLGSAAILAVAAALAYAAWQRWRPADASEGLVRGNGRIEATEIDVAVRIGGRLSEVLVKEGEFVKAGQVLANIQVDTLEAQRDEARAQRTQAINAVTTAKAQIAARESDREAMQAAVAQRVSERDAANSKLKRSEALAAQGMWPKQDLDNDRAKALGADAAVAAAQAQVRAAQAAIDAARAQEAGAVAAVKAVEATLVRIEADINDSALKAPRDSRVQYRVANVGEVVGAGGKVLNLVDLSDVYMTFFLPSAVAGRVAIGSEARIVLDAAPEFVIPAKISFVSATAQFTPKTVETASEREKLMFRVRAQIDRELLLKHLKQVKTGLPGVVWLRSDPAREWPTSLAVKLPE